MGFALTWIGIKGKPPQGILDALQLKSTGQYDDGGDSDYAGFQSGDWYLVIDNNNNAIPSAELDYEDLSKGCEVMICSVEEHVMFSLAWFCRDGKTVWSVIHESEKGGDHLDEVGSLPPEYFSIRERLQSEQKADDERVERAADKNDFKNLPVDYIFDIPVELVQFITGFRHDRWRDGDRFEILVPESS